MPTDNENIAAKLDVLNSRVGGIETTMDKLADAVVQIARLEVAMANNSEAVRRSFDAIEKLNLHLDDHSRIADERIRKLEEAAPVNKLVSGWVLSWLAGAGGLAGGIAIGVLYMARL